MRCPEVPEVVVENFHFFFRTLWGTLVQQAPEAAWKESVLLGEICLKGIKDRKQIDQKSFEAFLLFCPGPGVSIRRWVLCLLRLFLFASWRVCFWRCLWLRFDPCGRQIVHKTAYWGSIRVGTPPQEFKAVELRKRNIHKKPSDLFVQVIFDTGSGNLILPTTSCRSEGYEAQP